MKLPEVHHLFDCTPDSPEGEVFHELLRGQAFRLEHILSRGQASPEGFWYDQEEEEWVLLLTGTALLAFEGERKLPLRAGDSLTIPAGMRHRVDACSQDARWLALHLGG